MINPKELSAPSEAEPPELPDPWAAYVRIAKERTNRAITLPTSHVRELGSAMLTFRAEGYSKGVADGRAQSQLARDFPPMGGMTECDMGDSYE